MYLLGIITITFAGLMVGNELAVSAFFNPAVRQLESTPQAQVLSILAGSLGRVMPIWYGLCLALLALEAFLHRHQAAFVPLLAATLIWVGVIVFTIGILVPHQQPHRFLEHDEAHTRLEARSQKVGLPPSGPHSLPGRSTCCPHLCIDRLTRLSHFKRDNSSLTGKPKAYAVHGSSASARTYASKYPPALCARTLIPQAFFHLSR